MRQLILLSLIFIVAGYASGTNVYETAIWDGETYYTIILWDQSPLAWVKAVDYYVIPYKSDENFAVCEEGPILVAHFDIKIVERTTWFGFLSRSRVIFDGNLPREGFVYGDFRFEREFMGNPVINGQCGKYERAFLIAQYPDSYTLKKEESVLSIRGGGLVG